MDHYACGPSEDNDFAEFDKYFNDFENEHTNLREGRESSNDLVPIHETTNREEWNTLNVITEPFDTSDIQSSDKYKPTRDKLRTADIWEIENHRKIAENKIKHNRAWVPITEPTK